MKFLSYLFVIGCIISLYNDYEDTLVYHIFHIDHAQQDRYPWPLRFAGGELKSGKTRGTKYCEKGRYYVEWNSLHWGPNANKFQNRMDFTVEEDTKGISISPQAINKE